MSLLEYLVSELGLLIVDKPEVIPERTPDQHPRGTLVEILDQLEKVGDKALSIRADKLTPGNVAVIYQQAHKRKYKIHAIQKGDRKIIWRETQVNNDLPAIPDHSTGGLFDGKSADSGLSAG